MGILSASNFDRTVQFRRATLVQGSWGSEQEWADHGAPISAGKSDISDAEKFSAGEVQATISTRFLVRWTSFTADLTPKDRLLCEGRDFNIVGIKEMPGNRRRILEITTVARAD